MRLQQEGLGEVGTLELMMERRPVEEVERTNLEELRRLSAGQLSRGPEEVAELQ